MWKLPAVIVIVLVACGSGLGDARTAQLTGEPTTVVVDTRLVECITTLTFLASSHTHPVSVNISRFWGVFGLSIDPTYLVDYVSPRIDEPNLTASGILGSRYQIDESPSGLLRASCGTLIDGALLTQLSDSVAP